MIGTPLGTVRFTGSPRIGPCAPALPEGYPEVTARAAVWRLTGPRPEVTLAARLTDPPPDSGGGADSGQYLEALTFESPTEVMSFGGPDIGGAHGLAERGHLPPRWTSLLPEWEGPADRYRVATSDTMITWHLPDLLAGESLALPVIVAWGGPAARPATWFAVSANLEQVLRQREPE
jgi:hypothetical protein